MLFDFSPGRPNRHRYLDDGVSGGFFETLKNAADQGNVWAAFRLYERTSNCQIGPSTEDELERMRELAGQDERTVLLDFDSHAKVELARAFTATA